MYLKLIFMRQTPVRQAIPDVPVHGDSNLLGRGWDVQLLWFFLVCMHAGSFSASGVPSDVLRDHDVSKRGMSPLQPEKAGTTSVQIGARTPYSCQSSCVV